MERNLIIIGAGPAGMSAGMYSARARIKTTVVEKFYPGGNMLITEKIDNYPGFKEGISGADLAEKMKEQYTDCGGEMIKGEVSDVDFTGQHKKIVLSTGEELSAAALIVASGSVRQKLGVEGEEKFAGRGVSYCALCDGAFFKNKKIAVVGGGNSALEEAIYLTRYADICYLIHRRDEFRASRHFQEELLKYPAVKPLLSTTVEKIEGSDRVNNIVVKRADINTVENIAVDGVFISVGQKPNVEFLKDKLEKNPNGYIITDYKMQTSQSGVFACGDVIRKSLYQVVTACGEGATAATSAEKHIDLQT